MAERVAYAFEAIDDSLPYIPLCARRVLDVLGRKLTLEGWLSLPIEDRQRFARAGAAERVDPDVASVLQRATPAAAEIEPRADPRGGSPPPEVLSALGPDRPLDARLWSSLRSLDRYALVKYTPKPDKLALAYDEIVSGGLTHVTRGGEVHMVDVGHKRETARRAIASARIVMTREALHAIATVSSAKGDVLAAARIAGILASKRTPELIPLCHPVRTTRATIDFEFASDRSELQVRATVEAVDRTGAEMEAMVAASVASLTVYDMIKSVDRWATIESVQLEAKSGGKSGEVNRPRERGGA